MSPQGERTSSDRATKTVNWYDISGLYLMQLFCAVVNTDFCVDAFRFISFQSLLIPDFLSCYLMVLS